MKNHFTKTMLANSPPHVDLYSSSQTKFHFKAIVYILVALFGLGTWTNISGVFIELPLIVSVLPESWQLPAKLTLLLNSANIFPIAVVFASLIFKINTVPFEVPVNFILLCCSILFAIGFAFLWDKTAFIFGSEQSVYLMLLCFSTAIADCLSSTTFIPFLHRYEPMYLNAYFVGEALTALCPALLGLIQGIGASDCTKPNNGTVIEVHHGGRFSVRTYFILLSLLPFIALVSFTSLRLMKTGRLKVPIKPTKAKHHQSRVFILMENIDDINQIQQTIQKIDKIENQLQKLNKTNRFRSFLFSQPAVYLFIVFQCSAMLYGAAQGLTTFSLNAYSSQTFHYTIIVSKQKKTKHFFLSLKSISFFLSIFQGQFAYPLVTFIGAFIPEVSPKLIYVLYVTSTSLFAYIFITVNDRHREREREKKETRND